MCVSIKLYKNERWPRWAPIVGHSPFSCLLQDTSKGDRCPLMNLKAKTGE